MTALTVGVMLGVLTLAVIIWDIYLVVDDRRGNEISSVVTWVAYRAAALPYALGILMGHWLWPITERLLAMPSAAFAMMSGAGVISMVNIIGRRSGVRLLWAMPIIHAVVGAWVGHLVWGASLPGG